MKITNQRWYILMAGVLALGVGVGCSSDDDDDSPSTSAATTASTSSTETETSTSSAASSDNALASAFPGTLALTVFPKAGSTSLALADDAFDPNAKSMQDKVAEQEAIAKGKADSCMPAALGKSFTKGAEETCYEFDQDMIYATNDSSKASPIWLGTQTGTAAASKEACLVSFTRNQVSQVVAMVDQTLGFGMAAICQHKKLNAGVELPLAGSALDLRPALADLFGDKAKVNSATMERLEDASDGRPVYRILISVVNGKDSIERTVGIIHSPKDDSNSEYQGTLFTVMKGVPSFEAPGSNAPKSTKHQLLSITYKRAKSGSSNKITAELRSAQMAPALAEKAITSAGVLDYNVGTNVASATVGSNTYGNYSSYPQSNDAVDGITFVAFDLDATTNEGTLAYWKNPGGNYYENARGFNISIGKNAGSGVLEGCATSGAASTDMGNGTSIRRYLNSYETSTALSLQPKGFWHPFINSSTGSGSDAKGSFLTRTQPSGQVTKWYKPSLTDATIRDNFVSQQNGSLISRQCFKFNAASSLYEIDTTKTTEAAGYEVIDTGSPVNNAKFITLPPRVQPPVQKAL